MEYNNIKIMKNMINYSISNCVNFISETDKENCRNRRKYYIKEMVNSILSI